MICYVVLSLYMVMSHLFMLNILYVRNTYISVHYTVKHMGMICMVDYVVKCWEYKSTVGAYLALILYRNIIRVYYL